MTREVGTVFAVSFLSAGANVSYGYAVTHHHLWMAVGCGFTMPLLQTATVALVSARMTDQPFRRQATLVLASGAAWASAISLALLSLY